MAVNLSALSNVTTTATTLSNLILVSPQKTVGYQPQNKPSISGDTSQQPPFLLFHYEGENTSSFKSDATDHFIEDNTSIQDQVALPPVRVSTQGFIGELNDVTPTLLQPLKTIADKLTVIDAYTPALSSTAQLAYNDALQLYQVAVNAANAAVSTWSSIAGNGGTTVINGSNINSQPNQTKQQIAYQQFIGYYRNKTLFTVQTPWAIFQDMIIEDFRVVQGEDTNVISNFEVTFKQLRFASTNTTLKANDASNFSGRSAAQASSLSDLGTSTPQSSTTSLSDVIGQTA